MLTGTDGVEVATSLSGATEVVDEADEASTDVVEAAWLVETSAAEVEEEDEADEVAEVPAAEADVMPAGVSSVSVSP